MTEDRDDLLTDLRAALDIRPSVGFEARVRQRVERVARPWVLRSWVAGAAVAGVAGLTLVLAIGHRVPPRLESSELSATRVGDAVRLVEGQPRHETVRDESQRTLRPRSERASATALKAETMPAEIIVPPDQEARILRLAAEIRAGRIVFGDTPSPVADRITLVALSAPARLDVPPLGVEPLSVDAVSDFRR